MSDTRPEQDQHQSERRAFSSSQVAKAAEQEAQKILGVSSEEAFAMLDRGELAGTAAEVEFRMLRHVLD